MVEFSIDELSAVPVIRQIQDQVKLAVAMGILRTGDTLPSIRDVEKQTGINRGQIHRAYFNLRQAGLLKLTRGKGTVISAVAVSPHSTNEKCQQLSRKTISSAIRGLGVSPTAFARYLSRYAQNVERSDPFIAYVDPDKEIAHERATEISRLWEVFVIGMTTDQLRSAIGRHSTLRKVLANHLFCDQIKTSSFQNRIELIPIEIRYTQQAIRELARIKANSSALVVLPAHAMHSARFIVSQLHKWIRARGVDISWISVRKISSFEKLLNGSHYDYIIVTPGARGSVPPKLRKSSYLLLLRMELDPASLEAARIRAGVII